MDTYNRDFYQSLSKHPRSRTDQDLRTIYACLRRLDIFQNLNDAPLRAICRSARFEQHPANSILFRKGQVATCWYILLTGAVFMDKQMYLPRGCFGKRSGHSYRRPNDCMVLEPSDMIVIDYPDVQHIPVQQVASSDQPQSVGRRGVQSTSFDREAAGNQQQNYSNSRSAASHSRQPQPFPVTLPPSSPNLPRDNRHHHHHQQTSGSNSSTPTSTLTRQKPPTGLPRSYNSNNLSGEQQQQQQQKSHINMASAQQSQGAHTYRSEIYLNGGPSTADENHGNQPTKFRANYSKHNSAPENGGSVGYRSCNGRARSAASYSSATTDNDDILAGLPEAAVDSEDEDEEDSCPSHDSYHELKDNVRDCLEKEPWERTEDDLSILLDFMQHMPALASLPLCVKRALCLKMVFAVVPEAGTIVMHDKERLDSWSVIVNGQVEIRLPTGERIEHGLGDSFGCHPIPEPQLHNGQMRTLVDDCEFVLVEHKDYCEIMAMAKDHIVQHMDNSGLVILHETEIRRVDGHEGYVLIKGKAEKLISHLVEDRDTLVDPHFVDDLLLMYRVFIQDPTMIIEKLMLWFAEPHLRDKVARILLLWVNNHFNDFETNPDMMKLLERFEQALERDNMQSQQALLNIACSVKSRTRTVTYSRSQRDEVLHFSVLGGAPNYGIFVSKVDDGSQAEKVGLKRGDELIEVNGQNFQHITHQRALELLRSSTHLSITVKSNLLGFKEMLSAPENGSDLTDSAPSGVARKPPKFTKNKTMGNLIPPDNRLPLHPHSHSSAQLPSCNGNRPSYGRHDSPGRGGDKSRPPPVCSKSGGNSMVDRLLSKLKGSGGSLSSMEHGVDDPSLTTSISGRVPPLGAVRTGPHQLRPSRSNPDIHATVTGNSNSNIAHYYQPVKSVHPEHVLKIYRGDQSFKYLTVYKETTAQNVVQLALQEFGMSSDAASTEWSLCEAKVTPEGLNKQSRLPDQLSNLAERISLNSRYYLKSNSKSDPLVPDELAPEIIKEAATQLMQLNAQIVAAQLTLQDFSVFAAIEPTEYVDNLFKLDSRYGWPKLSEFEELFNREMWWVATEICREKAVYKRAKLVKKLIKVAKFCRDFKNFNSMFAIMSGLEKPSVRRMHHTWERVSPKYMKVFDDMQQLLDPSRNMSRYRQHLAHCSQEPPVVPLFPVIKKDLTFIHEGNQTYIDSMVNFEKLRMMAKEIRGASKLASAPYELSSMAEGGPGGLNDALLHMNSFDGSTATMRRLNTTPKAPQPRKKVYEQALMVRKVKSYLSDLTVISDENELDRLSLENEPQPINAPGSSAMPGRRRLPSPSPSSVSSNSNNSDQRKFQGPKFGADSPQAVQKMFSLVHNSRVKPVSTVPLPFRTVSSSSDHGASFPSRIGAGGGSPQIEKRKSHPSKALYRAPSLKSNGTAAAPGLNHHGPVDLSAECSSVTNLDPILAGHVFRLSSAGSVTSTDSAVSETAKGPTRDSSVGSQNQMSHAVSCDSTDSGHASIADAVGSGSVSKGQILGAAQMVHRPNPAFFANSNGHVPQRHGKGKAPAPPQQVHKNYTNVQVGLMGKIDENGTTPEQVSRV